MLGAEALAAKVLTAEVLAAEWHSQWQLYGTYIILIANISRLTQKAIPNTFLGDIGVFAFDNHLGMHARSRLQGL